MCNILNDHKWTCKAKQGIAPVAGESFWDYSKMYCECCGKESNLNR